MPDSDADILKTIELKNKFVEGTYTTKNEDIPFLKSLTMEGPKSYAAAVKQKNVFIDGKKEINVDFHDAVKTKKVKDNSSF